MDASHILVGGLIAVAVALLVWIEIRCRRNSAAQAEQQSLSVFGRGGTTASKKDPPCPPMMQRKHCIGDFRPAHGRADECRDT